MLALVTLCAVPSRAQEDDQAPTFRVDVNVVNVFFNVKHKNGTLVPDLQKEQFQVFEDGKPQTIKYFKREADQPLTMGMLIDTSGSQMRVLGMEQEVGAQFLEQVLRPKDLAFLISFDINVNLEHDFTSEGKALRSGLRNMKVNTGGGGGGVPGLGGGPIPQTRPRGTLLHDAVFLAADEKLKSEVGRKALIILTDGEDQGSRMSINQAIEAAQKADAICYVLLIQDDAVYSGFGSGEMKKLAEQTGGRVIDVGNEQKRLKEALDQISNELRTQYMIGYTPTNAARDGGYRKIEIKTTAKDLRIQARKGYFAPKGD